MTRKQSGYGATVGRMAVVALCLWCSAACAATPLLAQGAAGLVAPPLNEAAKPVKPAEPAAAPAGAAPAAAANAAPKEQPSLTAGLIKYGPSYVLMVLLVGLGTFIACGPRPGSLGQAEAGKDKTKGSGKK